MLFFPNYHLNNIIWDITFLGVFFWGGACCFANRILVPPRGIEPRPLAVSVLSPNHWTAKEFPRIFHLETWDWRDGKAEGEKGTRGPGISMPDRSQSSRKISLGFQNNETNWKYTWQVTSFLQKTGCFVLQVYIVFTSNKTTAKYNVRRKHLLLSTILNSSGLHLQF